jgi:hypothetical protein
VHLKFSFVYSKTRSFSYFSKLLFLYLFLHQLNFRGHIYHLVILLCAELASTLSLHSNLYTLFGLVPDLNICFTACGSLIWDCLPPVTQSDFRYPKTKVSRWIPSNNRDQKVESGLFHTSNSSKID